MKLEFDSSIEVDVPPEHAFDYFADYHHVAQVLDGVTRWEPIGSKTEGVGARYNVEMVTLGFSLKNVLRLSRWRRPDMIGWESESGLIKQEGGFRFKPRNGGVRIELHIGYEPPGWALGATVARSMDGTVRARLRRALEKIKATLES
jgi:uncharacterized membrane protein